MGLLTVQEVEFAVQVAKLRHSDRTLQFIEVNFIEPTKVLSDNYQLCNY